jgi:predicted MFS family arabinose efflux permease
MIAGVAAVAACLCLALPAVRLPDASLRERFRILAAPGILLLLVGTALQMLPQYSVFSYIAPILGAGGQTATPVLIAMIVFGVAYFTGNRLVGRLTDHWGGLRVATIGLSVSVLALLTLWAVRPGITASVLALALLGLVGSFQVTPQQTRLFKVSGDAATVALGLNGSMIYVGSGAGAALGGGVIASAGAGIVPLVGVGTALVALAFLLITAPERHRRKAADDRWDPLAGTDQPAQGQQPDAASRLPKTNNHST